MKLRFICFFVLFVVACLDPAVAYQKRVLTSQVPDAYYQITDVQLKEKPLAPRLKMQLERKIQSHSLSMSMPAEIQKNSLDDILNNDLFGMINTGLQIWKIIIEGSPAVNLSLQRASALPAALKHWEEMENWSDLQIREYELVYLNGFGMEVIKFQFFLTYNYGGSLNGVGQYLSQVGILIKHLEIKRGFDLDVGIEVARIVNMGTRLKPLAMMEMNMTWTTGSSLQRISDSYHFQLKGNGELIAF